MKITVQKMIIISEQWMNNVTIGGDQRDAGRPSIMNTLATDTSIINNENNSAKKW